MQFQQLISKQPHHASSLSRWFLLFLVMHVLCWTLAPTLIRYNLPLDSIEGTLWGHQWEWGYDKNPFLNAWLTSIAITIGGASGWMVYLFSQLSVAICFFCVWRLAKCILPTTSALIAVMLLEGVQYYHFHAIDFNDNTLELGLWSLTIYFFYQATRKQNNNTFEWILTGFFAGLGMMAKYYTAALMAAMLLFMLSRKENRTQLLSRSPYFGLCFFLLVSAPHIIWLFHHQFITVQYVVERGSAVHHWSNHIFFPLQFIWQQLEAFLPAIALALPLLIGKKRNDTHVYACYEIGSFNHAFLFFMGLGPMLLTAGLSLLFGIKLRAGWGMPLLSLWSIILLSWLQPDITTQKLKAFMTVIFVLLVMLIFGYAYSLVYSTTETTANYPGKEIAKHITTLWEQKYHRPLKYVAGSRWLGGNIGLYSTHHPAVMIEWDNKRSPWINNDDMEKEGAIFIWEASGHEILPDNVKARYPHLLPQQELSFNLHRNQQHKIPPVRIGIAFLPPRVH